MPGSAGLFQHAIIESGNCGGLLNFTPTVAQAQADQLAQTLGCTDPSTELSCMRAKDAATVMTALPGRRALIGPTGVDWGPVADGVVLPATPIDSLRAGHFAKVPVILGSNHDEGNLFTYLWNASTPQLAASDVQPIAQALWGTADGTAIASRYTGMYGTPVSQLSNVFTDGAFACPMRRAARAIVAGGGVAYLYQFTHPFNPGLASGLGAAHSFEIPYVWGNTWLGTRPPDSDAPLVAAIQGYWGRFAATGDPNGHGSAVAWPKYTASGDENIVLDTTITTASGLKSSACDFWDSLP
jgi:para-nitrobenzyl esterase